jgi:hypothetical protein
MTAKADPELLTFLSAWDRAKEQPGYNKPAWNVWHSLYSKDETRFTYATWCEFIYGLDPSVAASVAAKVQDRSAHEPSTRDLLTDLDDLRLWERVVLAVLPSMIEPRPYSGPEYEQRDAAKVVRAGLFGGLVVEGRHEMAQRLRDARSGVVPKPENQTNRENER